MDWHEPIKVMTPCKCGRTVTITRPEAIEALDKLQVNPMCDECKRAIDRRLDEKYRAALEW